jgi:acetolactate synthase-1/2/3 large subunit
MKASDYIVEFLAAHGVHVVFGYSGGAITHIMDSLQRAEDVRFIQTYHEQTAAIAAEGVSWFGKTVGVAIATSGPGATNLLTGIADAYFDSIPSLFITGQVNTYEYKNDKPIRQQGFQETDIVSIVKPITKYAALVADATRLRYELEKAWFTAKSGRGGPVLLDIPMNVQRADVVEDDLVPYDGDSPVTSQSIRYMGGFSEENLKRLIESAKRPVVLLGSGVLLSGAVAEYRAFIRSNALPVVTSLLGKGAYPEDDPLSVGMIGSYGNRCANIALANADLVLAVGTRLDTRQTGTNLASFVREGRIVRIDIDEMELANHRLKNVDAMLGDAGKALHTMDGMPWTSKSDSWLSYIARLKSEYGQEAETARNVENKTPYRVMSALNRFSAENQIYTVDIGQNQMFAAQTIRIRGRQEWKTSGGLAPMGFSLPTAIGAAFATNMARPIFAIVGDGGLHMSMQSLLLISQYHLPVKIILLNNRSLGMITQFQDLYFDKRKSGTTKDSGYLVPEFSAVARACGLPYAHFADDDFDVGDVLGNLIAAHGPGLIEFDVGEDTVVYPKLEMNMPIEDIDPKLSSEELRAAMIIDVLKQ